MLSLAQTASRKNTRASVRSGERKALRARTWRMKAGTELPLGSTVHMAPRSRFSATMAAPVSEPWGDKYAKGWARPPRHGEASFTARGYPHREQNPVACEFNLQPVSFLGLGLSPAW